jgi:hypothetical protein
MARWNVKIEKVAIQGLQPITDAARIQGLRDGGIQALKQKRSSKLWKIPVTFH